MKLPRGQVVSHGYRFLSGIIVSKELLGASFSQEAVSARQLLIAFVRNC